MNRLTRLARLIDFSINCSSDLVHSFPLTLPSPATTTEHLLIPRAGEGILFGVSAALPILSVTKLFEQSAIGNFTCSESSFFWQESKRFIEVKCNVALTPKRTPSPAHGD